MNGAKKKHHYEVPGWIWEPDRPKMKTCSEPSSETEYSLISLGLSLNDTIFKKSLNQVLVGLGQRIKQHM